MKGGATRNDSKQLCQASSHGIRFCHNIASKATDSVLNASECQKVRKQGRDDIIVKLNFQSLIPTSFSHYFPTVM